MTTEASLRTNPASLAAVHRRSTTKAEVFEHIPAGIAAVLQALEAADVEPIGPPATTFHSIPEADSNGEIAVSLPIPVAIAGDDSVVTVALPEHTVASLMHHGSYETLGDTYTMVATWIQANGHTIVGPPSETYFNSPGEVAVVDLRTEIAFPVEVAAQN